jgi:MATE family multidrug resistance protein
MYVFATCGAYLFNYVLIYWIFFPKLGILGAALGTVLSRIKDGRFYALLMKETPIEKTTSKF